ncbi:hypothetical protein H2248_008952 [Termitomyces sp. 'cryptogamus']|nr:hypothetical protein H2248_008952 [Termitomyces sp. 'cryptogamus']
MYTTTMTSSFIDILHPLSPLSRSNHTYIHILPASFRLMHIDYHIMYELELTSPQYRLSLELPASCRLNRRLIHFHPIYSLPFTVTADVPSHMYNISIVIYHIRLGVSFHDMRLSSQTRLVPRVCLPKRANEIEFKDRSTA